MTLLVLGLIVWTLAHLLKRARARRAGRARRARWAPGRPAG